MAISPDGKHWILINASPDLRAQIEAERSFQPEPKARRHTPIAGVIVTNADLDHALGLFLLRGSPVLRLCATMAVQSCLRTDLNLERVLGAFGEVEWSTPSEAAEPVAHPFGPVALTVRAIPLPARAPRFASGEADAPGHSIALEIVGTASRMLLAPDVSTLTPELTAAMERADVILFDGTFWDEEELQRIDPAARTASEMGHLPVKESVLHLAQCPAPMKALLHLNNSNPVLLPHSPERETLEAAGVTLCEDGMELML